MGGGGLMALTGARIEILLEGKEPCGILQQWMVQEGDTVREGDTLGLIQFTEHPKPVAITTPRTGRIHQLHGEQGQTVAVGEVLAICIVDNLKKVKYDTAPIVGAIELLQKKRRDILAHAARRPTPPENSEETQMTHDLCDLIDQEIKEQRIVLLRMYKELKRKEAERFDPEFTPWRVTRDLVEEHCKYVPRLPLDSRLVIPPEASLTFTTQVGTMEEEHRMASYFYGRATSTYPYLSYKEQREGEPICDQYRVFLTPTYALIAVADGCNWGKAPAQAAAKSAKTFIDYLKRNRDLFLNSSRVSRLCLEGLAAAHDSIIAGPYQEGQRIGTTTLLGGLLGKVVLPGNEEKAEEELDDWVFIFASIGDCKAFLWDSKNERVEELTPDSRSGENFLDPSDCGGRIGPYVDGGPDLRNLEVFMSPCVTNDLIFLCSDGVHDNFDPQMHGMSPKDLGLEQECWEDCTPSQANTAKAEWRTEEMKRIINSDSPCAEDMTNRFVDYCRKMNQPAQTFMQEHPGKRLPNDYARFPGKMDHTTMITIRVGEIPISMFQSRDSPRGNFLRTESELQPLETSSSSAFPSKSQFSRVSRRTGSHNLSASACGVMPKRTSHQHAKSIAASSEGTRRHPDTADSPSVIFRRSPNRGPGEYKMRRQKRHSASTTLQKALEPSPPPSRKFSLAP